MSPTNDHPVYFHYQDLDRIVLFEAACMSLKLVLALCTKFVLENNEVFLDNKERIVVFVKNFVEICWCIS